MWNNNCFLSTARSLFAILLFGLSAQSFAQVVANDDVFAASDLQQIFDPNNGECGTGYVFNPFSNDAVSNPDYAAIESAGFPRSSGQGQIFVDGSQSVSRLIYFPSCPGDGSFSTPAVFQYTLFDTNDPNSSDTAQITFTPPAQPSTTDDFYNSINPNQVREVPTQVTGVFDYVLLQSPLDNDTVTPPADMAGTLSSIQQGNFTRVSGIGSLQIFSNQSGTEFTYVPGAPFTQTATFSYFLTNGNGGRIAGTDALITINPPTQADVADDVYDLDAGGFATVTDNQGNIGFILSPDPFANDTITANVDITQTVTVANFSQDGGDGVLTVGIDQNNNPVFTFFPGTQQPSLYFYALYDATGNALTSGAQITVNGTGSNVVDAQDDAVAADDLVTVTDPTTSDIGYRIDPLANDVFVGQDPSNLDLVQTLAASNFVRVQGAGDIQANNNNGVEVIYYPRGAFNQAAVFNYTLYDSSGNTDSASITINPPGTQAPTAPINRKSNINDACDVEAANQRVPAICSGAITDSERLLMLSTITAQSDALFGMQGDLIGNIRQRMSENRSVYNPASVAGLNSTLYGNSVPIGQIAQELLKPLTGGGAANDLGNSGRLGFFLNGNFSAGDRDETGLSGGYDQEGYNFTSGIDYRLSLNLIMGAALGIANEKTDFASNRGEQSADATSFSFYGNYFPSNSLYADWLFMLTQGDLNIDRNVNIGAISEVAEADTNGDLWSFAGTLGYHWNSGAWEMDGYSRVEYSSLQIDGYSESGSSFDLTVLDQEAESLEAALGFKVARVVSLKSGVLVPSLDLEWLSQFEDDVRFIGVNMEQISTGFAVKDEGADSSYFNAAFSLSSVFANGFSAYFRMESQMGDDHIGRTTYGGGLRWEF